MDHLVNIKEDNSKPLKFYEACFVSNRKSKSLDNIATMVASSFLPGDENLISCNIIYIAITAAVNYLSYVYITLWAAIWGMELDYLIKND